MTIQELNTMSNLIRQDIIDIAFKAQGPSHPGPALSSADIVTALYFDIMNVDPKNPGWVDRDRMVFSKGHACPVVYSALARKGFFPVEDLVTVRRINSYLQGHPDMKKTPGIDMTSGSLGNGLSAALGMALYAKQTGKKFKTFCILGDGECQEGTVWEAVLFAGSAKIDNLIAIVDQNQFQSCGSVGDILPMGSMEDKWRAFGWNVLTADGHNMEEVVSQLRAAKASEGMPTVIIASTVKGKGVSFMENDNSWHQRIPSEEQYNQAMSELKEVV